MDIRIKGYCGTFYSKDVLKGIAQKKVGNAVLKIIMCEQLKILLLTSSETKKISSVSIHESSRVQSSSTINNLLWLHEFCTWLCQMLVTYSRRTSGQTATLCGQSTMLVTMRVWEKTTWTEWDGIRGCGKLA